MEGFACHCDEWKLNHGVNRDPLNIFKSGSDEWRSSKDLLFLP